MSTAWDAKARARPFQDRVPCSDFVERLGSIIDLTNVCGTAADHFRFHQP
jgi:hypothetical protein